MIYQTLQEATRARGARKIKIINIGLEPWEAVDMGLEVETVEAKDAASRSPNMSPITTAIDWKEWLQTHRVELNAMTTPQLIEWLDQKMETFGAGKLIPPAEVLEEELAGTDRKESSRRNHQAHPARRRAGRPSRHGHGGARTAGRRGAGPRNRAIVQGPAGR